MLNVDPSESIGAGDQAESALGSDLLERGGEQLFGGLPGLVEADGLRRVVAGGLQGRLVDLNRRPDFQRDLFEQSSEVDLVEGDRAHRLSEDFLQ